MDPNQTYEDLCRAMRAMNVAFTSCEPVDTGDIDDAIELFDALDNWLRKGGFLPNAWTKHR